MVKTENDEKMGEAFIAVRKSPDTCTHMSEQFMEIVKSSPGINLLLILKMVTARESSEVWVSA